MVTGLKDLLGMVFGDVRQSSNTQFQVNCPNCTKQNNYVPDGKYNFEVSTTKELCKCWKCGYGGTIDSIIKRNSKSVDYEFYKDLLFSNNMSNLKNRYKNNDEEDDDIITLQLPDEYIPFSKMDDFDPKHIQAYDYLRLDRRISNDLIEKFNIGFCTYGKFRNRIIIPSYDSFGAINYFIARSFVIGQIPYKNPQADKTSIIFNEYNINWDFTLYLVEGAFELLTVPYNTTPILGKKISYNLFKKILEYRPNIITILDPDALVESYQIFENLYDCGFENKIKFVDLQSSKDLDLHRKTYGDNAVLDVIKQARRMKFEELTKIKIMKKQSELKKHAQAKKFYR
jgi:DNA primase